MSLTSKARSGRGRRVEQAWAEGHRYPRAPHTARQARPRARPTHFPGSASSFESVLLTSISMSMCASSDVRTCGATTHMHNTHTTTT